MLEVYIDIGENDIRKIDIGENCMNCVNADEVAGKVGFLI